MNYCWRCGEEVCCCVEAFNAEAADLYYDSWREHEALEASREDQWALQDEREEIWELMRRNTC